MLAAPAGSATWLPEDQDATVCISSGVGKASAAADEAKATAVDCGARCADAADDNFAVVDLLGGRSVAAVAGSAAISSSATTTTTSSSSSLAGLVIDGLWAAYEWATAPAAAHQQDASSSGSGHDEPSGDGDEGGRCDAEAWRSRFRSVLCCLAPPMFPAAGGGLQLPFGLQQPAAAAALSSSPPSSSDDDAPAKAPGAAVAMQRFCPPPPERFAAASAAAAAAAAAAEAAAAAAATPTTPDDADADCLVVASVDALAAACGAGAGAANAAPTPCGLAWPPPPPPMAARPPLLPPRAPEDAGKKTLVLDLDETLVHSSFAPPAPPALRADFVVPVPIEGRLVSIYVTKRPGVDRFLAAVGEIFEVRCVCVLGWGGWMEGAVREWCGRYACRVTHTQQTDDSAPKSQPQTIPKPPDKRTNIQVVVFTASLAKYASPLLDLMDPGRRLVRHRLYRDACAPLLDGACGGALGYAKDLTCLGRDLAGVVLVDNSPQAYTFQPDNGAGIASFVGDASDRELEFLLPRLLRLDGAADVRAELGPLNVGAAYPGPPAAAAAAKGGAEKAAKGGGGAGAGAPLTPQPSAELPARVASDAGSDGGGDSDSDVSGEFAAAAAALVPQQLRIAGVVCA